jgi:hypothetical protein
MMTSNTIQKKPAKYLVAAAAAGMLSLLSALPAAAQNVPSYAAPGADETIQGTVAAVNGPYNISVRDVRGYIDNVTLHQGTIINPTGLELAPGESVSIVGNAQGSTFAANEIDTPYQSLAAVPAYIGYPYGPTYGIGLRFGRGFGFGFRG